MNFIDSGVVFHVKAQEEGLSNVYDRILVSDQVHIDLDPHEVVDGLEEIELGGEGCRSNIEIRLAEVFNTELFESKSRRLAHGLNTRYGELLKYDVKEKLARFSDYRHQPTQYVIDGVVFTAEAQKHNTRLFV
ncbi:hypothetical protein G7Z17_g7712 [Cylindrodendrum hubeiense]|uniref:Uncharacterized protein n=1 Tax=Cylindrodendrum hubeiense TaxID=595255 RepID=A0A9P5H393_9HYPO|nr:hypothetical protein G7Z17_g7712 [Cylindrodendrum hubeiense]